MGRTSCRQSRHTAGLFRLGKAPTGGKKAIRESTHDPQEGGKSNANRRPPILIAPMILSE